MEDKKSSPLAVGERLPCRVETLTVGGRGLCRVEGMALFLERALPGQLVTAEITVVKKGYAEGRTVEVLERGPEDRTADCGHFQACGGCAWQELPYADQLRWKREFVRESLARLGGLPDVEVADALTTGQEWRYRNKMEFAFAGQGANLKLGLRALGAPDRVLDLQSCRLLPESGEPLLRRVRDLCRDSGVGSWRDESPGRTGPRPARPAEGGGDRRPGRGGLEPSGYWRWLTLRRSEASGEWLAQFITAPRGPHAMVRELGERLRREFPSLTSVVHSARWSRSQVAQAERTLWRSGPGWLEERLDRIRYRVSADSFFQTNTAGARLLYDQVRELAGLTGAERLLDLYCGNGGMALYLADRAARVTGVEVSQAAVADARLNAELNGLDNCVFLQGDLGGDSAAGLLAEAAPDVVVVDPPRAGLRPEVVQALLRSAPPRLVYVSCNPSTQARDVKLLRAAYAVSAVRPVDLFPQTPHVECVMRLDRVSP